MEIRRFDGANLRPDNGLVAQRLLPWPALALPFEGSWCHVAPGAASGAHAHHEFEIWIAVSGAATIVHAGAHVPFSAGDVVYFPPHTEHQVVNDGDQDFKMYALWWDGASARGFLDAA
jgi:oxalate decarboxylase/phosphoglucose isomerase-like protein (cupin superfamily)